VKGSRWALHERRSLVTSTTARERSQRFVVKPQVEAKARSEEATQGSTTSGEGVESSLLVNKN